MHQTPSSQLPSGPIAVASLGLEDRDGALFARFVTNDDVRHRSVDVVQHFSDASELIAAVKEFVERFNSQAIS